MFWRCPFINDWKKGEINFYIDYSTAVGPDEVLRKGNGNDWIHTGSAYSTIYAGAGNDNVGFYPGASNALVYLEADDDYTNVRYGSYSTVYGGKGNDTIRLTVNNIRGEGNDLFIPLGNTKDSTLLGDEGDDTFWFIESSAVSISGGSGKDTYRFDPYYLYGPYHNDLVITDLSR